MATHSNFLLSIITTFLVLLLLSPNPTTAITAASPVLDTKGNPVEAGKAYHILLEEVTHGGNPGLSVRPMPNGPRCPKYVLQAPTLTEPRVPVKFVPSNHTQKHILTSSDVTIIFSKSNGCTTKPVWKMTTGANSGRIMVATEGMSGNCIESVTNWFKIEKEHGDGERYKIKYCPNSAPTHREITVCGDLSLFRDDSGELCPTYGLRWLSLSSDASDTPVWVKFIKA